MPNFAIIVEGSHDASFLGQLLKARNFSQATKLSAVPADWQSLFPSKFPMDGETLERVMRFPEIYKLEDNVVGITTAGSDSKLISTLRSVIDVIDTSNLSGVAIFIDTDNHTVQKRFESVQKHITAMNKAASDERQPGYPIVVPSRPGVMEPGSPAVGIFLFPDNQQQGALEDILLSCAQLTNPDLASAAVKIVADLDSSLPADHKGLKNLRKGMGRGKAAAGIVANLLKPGVSLASSLSQSSWLENPAFQQKLVGDTDSFLGDLLGK